MKPVTEREREEGQRRRRWKFDGTLTLGNAAVIISLIAGAVSLYVRGAERDTRQDAEIVRVEQRHEAAVLRIDNQIAAMVLTIQEIARQGNRLTAVETKIEGMEEDITWIRRWLERAEPAQ